jgi:hypothetical protein
MNKPIRTLKIQQALETGNQKEKQYQEIMISIQSFIDVQLNKLTGEKELNEIEIAFWRKQKKMFSKLLFRYSEEAFNQGVSNQTREKRVTNTIEHIGEFMNDPVELYKQESIIRVAINNFSNSIKTENISHEVKKHQNNQNSRSHGKRHGIYN